MNTISDLIHVLSKEEKREFLQRTRQKNRRTDVRNVALFKWIEQGNTGSAEHYLYGKPSRNAYHALCKRLQDSLIDFIATKSFEQETSDELEILKLLLTSRILFEHRQYKTGFKTLKRAERKAVQHDLYAALHEIYHTYIQYAHLDPSRSLIALSEATTRNMELLRQESLLNTAYASIKEKLKAPKGLSISKIVTEAFMTFDIEIDSSLTFKSLYQLMHVSVAAATELSDYYSIAPLMKQLFEIVVTKEDRAEKHLYYYIEILHLMAVMHFRNKDFMQSLEFANKMEVALQKKQGVLYTRFSEKLEILQALNETYTGKIDTAIVRLRSLPNHSIHSRLLLTTCLFLKDQYAEAYAEIRQFYHSDAWYEKKAGWIWVLKKNIIEILSLIELDKLDLLMIRLQSFKKRYGKRLQYTDETRITQFIKLVEAYYNNPKEVTSQSFKDRVEHSFEWKGADREDIFVMSFYGWLKAKMERQKLYKSVLQLVHL